MRACESAAWVGGRHHNTHTHTHTHTYKYTYTYTYIYMYMYMYIYMYIHIHLRTRTRTRLTAKTTAVAAKGMWSRTRRSYLPMTHTLLSTPSASLSAHSTAPASPRPRCCSQRVSAHRSFSLSRTLSSLSLTLPLSHSRAHTRRGSAGKGEPRREDSQERGKTRRRETARTNSTHEPRGQPGAGRSARASSCRRAKRCCDDVAHTTRTPLRTNSSATPLPTCTCVCVCVCVCVCTRAGT